MRTDRYEVTLAEDLAAVPDIEQKVSGHAANKAAFDWNVPLGDTEVTDWERTDNPDGTATVVYTVREK